MGIGGLSWCFFCKPPMKREACYFVHLCYSYFQVIITTFSIKRDGFVYVLHVLGIFVVQCAMKSCASKFSSINDDEIQWQHLGYSMKAVCKKCQYFLNFSIIP